ncbi:hypothetical protein C0989_004291 [Termitomyces sp. Mn162]|nr:hypothetical protein C0989_004291 [Termitomyces sp. Mn162]
METLCEHAGITSAKEKKKRIVEYVDAVTEKEWRGFDSFEDDKSWDEFVKELKDLYSEAIDNVGQVFYLDHIYVIEDKLLSKYGHFKDAARNRHEDDQYDLSEVIAVEQSLVTQIPLVQKRGSQRRNQKKNWLTFKILSWQLANKSRQYNQGRQS